MPIEFHCTHCEQLVRAPNEAAGRKGKCPHCQNIVYIPLPPEDSGEIPLAPVDDDAERRAKRLETEARELERKLRGERSLPGEPAGSARRSAGRAGGAPDDPRALVRDFVAAMSEGRLQDAERCAYALTQAKPQAISVIDSLSTQDKPPADFPPLPRPVLLGFLKQLRARL
ncbi:MAG: hypothetical protein L6Q92_09620 [Phycisphaerae bacterium]|nr:hypothetical protein [Phycisphaerae bacterium]